MRGQGKYKQEQKSSETTNKGQLTDGAPTEMNAAQTDKKKSTAKLKA